MSYIHIETKIFFGFILKCIFFPYFFDEHFFSRAFNFRKNHQFWPFSVVNFFLCKVLAMPLKHTYLLLDLLKKKRKTFLLIEILKKRTLPQQVDLTAKEHKFEKKIVVCDSIFNLNMRSRILVAFQ